MILDLLHLLFSFRGRIARSSYWLAGLASGALFILTLVFLETEFGRRSSLLLYPFFFWIWTALGVKRMRDRGRSPTLLLVAIIPVLGPLWLLLELGCRRGTVGENQYGPDPYDARPDYLTVDLGPSS